MRNAKQDVLHFWFEETAPVQWFQINPEFDLEITQRFADLYRMTADGLCDGWATDADGALALIIILDQFSRNMFRGLPSAYAMDRKALEIAAQAIDKGFDQIHPPLRRRFFYLPFEHSENMEDQIKSIHFFERMKDIDPISFTHAQRHFQTIKTFGRFPHRNSIYGRATTASEEKYLTETQQSR